MNSFFFLVITLLSGAIAGTVLGLVNLVIVEPYLDKAIGIEVQNAIKEGEVVDPQEQQNYRIWQKGGEVFAGTFLGISFGALFGLVFSFGRKLLPGSTNTKKALVLAGILWLVLFMMPAIKYPPNPPTVGDPDTIYYRQSLYISFILISGLAALGLSFLYKIMSATPKSKLITVSIIYIGIMAIVFIAMPNNLDKITAPMDLAQGFRIASVVTMTVFWVVLGIVFGLLCDKLNPYGKAEYSTI